MMQPLRMRRDYDAPKEVEGEMLKEIPLQDYDQIGGPEKEPEIPCMEPEVGPGRGLGRGPGMGLRMGPGMGRLTCPHCGRIHVFRMAAIEKPIDLICPNCKGKVKTAAVYNDNGEYRAVVAKCLDPSFKKIRDLLPKDTKAIALMPDEVAVIHKELDKIYKKYRDLEKDQS